MMNIIKHKAKVSHFLLITIFIVTFFPSFLLLKNEISSFLIFSSISLLFFGFIFYIFLTVEYIIKDKILIIKTSFLSEEKINIDDIVSISKSNSLLSSPAPSFDRIEIKYKLNKSVIISPKKKNDFLNDLKKINPKIKITI